MQAKVVMLKNIYFNIYIIHATIFYGIKQKFANEVRAVKHAYILTAFACFRMIVILHILPHNKMC